MNIKSCNVEIYKSQLSRYKDLQEYNFFKRTVLNDHLNNLNYYFAHIQDTSSIVIDNTILKTYGISPIYNVYAILETLSFGANSSTSENSKTINKEQEY